MACFTAATSRDAKFAAAKIWRTRAHWLIESLHGGHVGWQEQYNIFAWKFFFSQSREFVLFLPSNMAAMQTLHCQLRTFAKFVQLCYPLCFRRRWRLFRSSSLREHNTLVWEHQSSAASETKSQSNERKQRGRPPWPGPADDEHILERQVTNGRQPPRRTLLSRTNWSSVSRPKYVWYKRPDECPVRAKDTHTQPR